jgi:hypothetical protein
MDLLQAKPYVVGKRTPLFYMDEHYKVQRMSITKEMVEGGKIVLPTLPYNQAEYELYIKDGEVYTDYFDNPLVFYTEKETGKVSEPFICKFVSWNLRRLLIHLGKVLRDKVKQDYKERYPLIRFVDANTSEVLVEFPSEDYYKENFALNEMSKVIERGHSDLVVQTYDKDEDAWILFEQKRLNYQADFENTKNQVQAEAQRWKEDL